MRLICSLFPGTIEFDETSVFTLILERKDIYRQALKELYAQVLGESGEWILSENDRILKIPTNVEMITDFVGFDPNNKKLLARIQKILEEEIEQGEEYAEGMAILSRIEQLLDRAGERFSFPVIYEGLTIGALVKIAAPKLIDDYETDLEKIIAYMELIRELMGERLFVMVGMKYYFTAQEMQLFIDTVVLHRYKVLLLESYESDILVNEKRMLLDNDICVI